jgi:FtsH-binding integral membrane protein
MKNTIFTVAAAGAFATIAFDAFGQGLSPLLGYAKLAPVGLANQTIKTVFGASPSGLAHLLHVFTGMVAYTLGYLLIARPVQQKIMPSLPWIATATAYGVVLWVFALYVMAHLVAGNKPFLGFSGITWVALWGHIIFAIVAAWVMEARGIVKTPARLQTAAA